MPPPHRAGVVIEEVSEAAAPSAGAAPLVEEAHEGVAESEDDDMPPLEASPAQPAAAPVAAPAAVPAAAFRGVPPVPPPGMDPQRMQEMLKVCGGGGAVRLQ